MGHNLSQLEQPDNIKKRGPTTDNPQCIKFDNGLKTDACKQNTADSQMSKNQFTTRAQRLCKISNLCR